MEAELNAVLRRMGQVCWYTDTQEVEAEGAQVELLAT
jgi:hypothetical protein